MIKAESADGQIAKIIKDMHYSPIRTIKFNHYLDLVISSDDSGMIEIWDPESYGEI